MASKKLSPHFTDCLRGSNDVYAKADEKVRKMLYPVSSPDVNIHTVSVVSNGKDDGVRNVIL
jgi:hypothetical protein